MCYLLWEVISALWWRKRNKMTSKKLLKGRFFANEIFDQNRFIYLFILYKWKSIAYLQ